MKRRSFLTALAGLPLVGRLFGEEPETTPALDTTSITLRELGDMMSAYVSEDARAIGNVSKDGVHWFPVQLTGGEYTVSFIERRPV